MPRAHVLGRLGERIAGRYLSDRGWEILDRNWRSGHAEVDLVIQRQDVIAFVEVKTRSQIASGDPLESITPRKRREVERVAGHWLRERGTQFSGVAVFRFDAVAVDVVPGRTPSVRHLADAWRMGESS